MSFSERRIEVKSAKNIQYQIVKVESDWSSASYFYSFVALSNIGTSVELSTYKKNSLQGDSILSELYQNFGVTTTFSDNKIFIKKENHGTLSHFEYDFSSCPDIAQTLTVTCFGLGVSCDFSGLHTLKIKETDRLSALKNELTKLGAWVEVTDNRLEMKCLQMIENISIETYNDHRMAMAFAPLCVRIPLIINDFEVVSKSYPSFWEDCVKIGVRLQEV